MGVCVCHPEAECLKLPDPFKKPRCMNLSPPLPFSITFHVPKWGIGLRVLGFGYLNGADFGLQVLPL